MEDIKQLMRHHYLQYASYVILDRAIPDIVDGLKPVQRRILYMLWLLHDGKLHKVANIAGQTMIFHPHGDGPITEALINIANKDYLLDKQGNFGNLLTGDAAAASRYIESRLTPLATETLFNPDLTSMIPSYDGRHMEPIVLPAKIPLLLMQGADGIAVGMSTHIFPHNFIELLEAEIAILEKKPFLILPDFQAGGIMDASQYDQGRGRIKLRAKMELRDAKTIVILQICHGTTTESLIHSIEEAAKKGKIKIDSIHDYTAEHIEIEIKLPRGQYAEETLNGLYAYTECEVTLHSQIVVIKDNHPCEPDVNEILNFNVVKLQEYIRCELEIEEKRLQEKIFFCALEQIFIEQRLYRELEEVAAETDIHGILSAALIPFHHLLWRTPNADDRERLLNIPIRRISRFDTSKNQDAMQEHHTQLQRVQKDLKNIPKVTIAYLQALIKKYRKSFPRRTVIDTIAQIDTRALETRQIKVGFDSETGFMGTKISTPNTIECSNFDKLLFLFGDGTYQIVNISEKQYMYHQNQKVIHFGIADKSTVFSIAYRDAATQLMYAKRFIIDKFIIDKIYCYVDEGMMVEYLSVLPNPVVSLELITKGRQKSKNVQFSFTKVQVKNVTAKGIRISPHIIQRIETAYLPIL